MPTVNVKITISESLTNAYSGIDSCTAFERLIVARQHVSPARLGLPAPDASALERIFSAAAAAPDHARLTPWRFVLIPHDKRRLLAEAFTLALMVLDPKASADQIAMAEEKAYRAPLLMLCIGKLGPCEPPIPPLERMISMGAAIQNMLLAARAMGFDSSITSGRAIVSQHIRELFALLDGEEAICFLNFGTTSTRRLHRVRPVPSAFVSTL